MSARGRSATTSTSTRSFHEKRKRQKPQHKKRAGLAKVAKASRRAKHTKFCFEGFAGHPRDPLPSRSSHLRCDLCVKAPVFRMRRIGIDVGGTNTDAVLL